MINTLSTEGFKKKWQSVGKLVNDSAVAFLLKKIQTFYCSLDAFFSQYALF